MTPADETAFLMQLVCGEAKLGAGHRAMRAVVVTEGRWPGRGRPKNSATDAEFSVTRERQAALAECSVRTIDGARRVYSYTRPSLTDDEHRRILRDVMQGRKSLQEAFRMLNYGRPDPNRRADSGLTLTDRLKILQVELGEVRAEWAADAIKIEELERERDRLKDTVRRQRAEIARLQDQLGRTRNSSYLSHQTQAETVTQTHG